MNTYLTSVIENVKKKQGNEPEFVQTVEEAVSYTHLDVYKRQAVECVGEIPSPVNVPTGCSFHTRCPYKCERCTKEDPVMREVEPGHTVRCHLIDK